MSDVSYMVRGQTAGMSDVSYMVRGRTQVECQRELDRLCRLLDAEPTQLPSDAVGRGWIARAVPATKAPGQTVRGSVMR